MASITDLLPESAQALVRIDLDHLDRELALQPESHRDHGLRVAECQYRLARAKHDLEVLEARTSQAARDLPTDEKRRPTEATIREQVVLNTEVQEATITCHGLQFQVNAARAMYEASEQKGWALKELAGLPGFIERSGSTVAEERLVSRLVNGRA